MWTPSILLILLWLQTAVAIPFVTDFRTEISYQGTSADGVEQFQNIFYAEDTSGINRFAPPVPYHPKRGSTIQATASGASCPQLPTGNANYPFGSVRSNLSENCLSLRIARPANQSFDKPLPVMVWIYGGGWVFGDAYDRFYNPEGLIQESVASGHPVVYVAINYRVGIFGFAASKALQDAKSENVGLRDQRAALEWVKDNIAAFGGDPEKITTFGESAGAISTALQITAFGGHQGAVFQKAIIDSGSYNFDFSTDRPFNYTASVARSLNCSRSNNDTTVDATLACLRGVPLETLLSVALAQAKNIAPPYGTGVIHPLVDGDFIPDEPSRLILDGSFVKGKIFGYALLHKTQSNVITGISLVHSWLADDGSQFVPSSINSETAVEAFFSRLFGNTTRDRLLSLYPVEDFEAQVLKNSTITAQYYRASRIYRDYLFACPALNLTNEISLQSTNQTYLWTLNTTRSQPVWDSLNHSEWQIAHTSDVAYFFNEDLVGGDNSKSALQLSAKLSSSYSAFATYGNPSTPDFNWPLAWSGQSAGNATVFVVGGPYGSGPATLEPSHDASAGSTLTANGSNATSANYQRSEALAQDKLVERCAFVDTIGPTVGASAS